MELSIFGEALRAITASCDYGIVLVGLMAIVITRAKLPVVAGVVAAGIVGGWLFVADAPNPLGRVGNTTAHIVVLVAMLIGVFMLRNRLWLAAGLAATAELLTTFWWRPCVGPELAQLLNHTSNGARTGLGMAIYMLGLLTPALIVACIIHLVWTTPRTSAQPAASTV